MGIYIKGFKPKDGLYQIQDGVIRKYKEKGGTVRPYELIEVKEPHGRLIDAAVEAADEWDGFYSRSREEIITMKLRMLPSADRPKGEWDYSDDMYETRVCSVCGFDTEDYKEYNFCPNCGSYNGGESDDKG